MGLGASLQRVVPAQVPDASASAPTVPIPPDEFRMMHTDNASLIAACPRDVIECIICRAYAPQLVVVTNYAMGPRPLRAHIFDRSDLHWSTRELPVEINRGHFHETCIAFGDDVVFTGGILKFAIDRTPEDYDANKYVNDVTSYSTRTHRHVSLPPMPSARQDYAITAINDGIFVSGGESADLRDDAALQVFSRQNQSWSVVSRDSPGMQCGHDAAILTHRMFVMGGITRGCQSLKSCFTYDIASARWMADGEIPISCRPSVLGRNETSLFFAHMKHQPSRSLVPTDDTGMWHRDVRTSSWTKCNGVVYQRPGRSVTIPQCEYAKLFDFEDSVYLTQVTLNGSSAPMTFTRRYDASADRWHENASLSHMKLGGCVQGVVSLPCASHVRL